MNRLVRFGKLTSSILGSSCSLLLSTTSICLATDFDSEQLQARASQRLETVASFRDVVPRSIAVSADSRIFLCCPRGHNSEAPTLVEIRDGKPVAYPDEKTNIIDSKNPNICLFSAMASVVDQNNILWVLDNGRQNRTLVYGGAKLVGIDLKTNAMVKTILLKNYVLSPDIVLYDLEIDPLHGKSGTAIIGASGSRAPGTIIISDLETGHTIRRLHHHPSLQPGPNLNAMVEGEMIKVRKDNESQQDWLPGTFGFTISGNSDQLYYSAVGSQDIFSVDLDKLCDPGTSNKDVEAAIKRIDYKVALGTGIECDKQNRLYLCDVEHSAICRRLPNGSLDIVARSEKLSYPDHLFIAGDGYLYITTSQFQKGEKPAFGEDERLPPFEVLRVFVNTTPATLCNHPF